MSKKGWVIVVLSSIMLILLVKYGLVGVFQG